MGAVLGICSAGCTALFCGYSCLKCCCTGAMGGDGLKPALAKLWYILFLGFGTLVAVAVGRIGEIQAEKDIEVLGFPLFQFSITCIDVGNEAICSGEGAILRASVASVFFFVAMMIGVIPTPQCSGEQRWRPLLTENFHRGFWGIKILVYVALVIAMFFWATFDEEAFTKVARFVSGLFLVFQVLALIDFAYDWNDSWVEWSDVENDYADGSMGWIIALIAMSGLLYIVAIGGIIGMLVLFAGCTSTIGITVAALILIVAGILITVLRPYIFDDDEGVGGSIAPPAVISFYIAFLTFSASTSNPDQSAECDPFGLQLGQSPGEIVISIIITIITLTWTAYNVSSRQSALVTGGTAEQADVGGAYEVQEADGTVKYARDVEGGQDVYGGGKGGDAEQTAEDVGDKLWFFHFIMITASFYMAMLLTNWGVSEGDLIVNGTGAGTISMFVKAAAAWAAGLLYIWTIVAPHILNREF